MKRFELDFTTIRTLVCLRFFAKTLAGPKISQKTLARPNIWAGVKLDIMFANKVELKPFYGSIIGLSISLLFLPMKLSSNVAYNLNFIIYVSEEPLFPQKPALFFINKQFIILDVKTN